MAWRGPEYEGEFPSLGWALVDWWEHYLQVPSGPHYGKPFVLTDDQAAFFVRLYALDEDGNSIYRRATRRGAKGRGKSPEGALFAAAEFAGPAVFDGWDSGGEPVGRPRDFPWVPVAAVAEEQTDNVWLALREMLAESDLVDDAAIDLGKTRIEFHNRPGKAEPVTSSAGAREGTPYTAAVMDETHLWLPSQGGDKLARTIRRNLGKTGGKSLEVTNAPALGERTVAEQTLEAAEKSQRGLLYDSVEADWDDAYDPKAPSNRSRVMKALAQAYKGVSTKEGGWVDIDRQYEECMDIDVPRSDIFRFYFNLARKADTRAFDPRQWRNAAKPRRHTDGPVVLMFDGARTRDCAVLSAWTTRDVPHHFGVKVWERPYNPDSDYEHPRGEIRATARQFIEDNDCVLFAYDQSFHELSSLYDEWLDEFGEADGKGDGLMVGYPTASGKRMETAVLRVIEDLRAQLFTHDGDDKITEHVDNAVLTRNRTGYLTLAKEKDSLKIDGAVTMTFGYDLVATARTIIDQRRVYSGPMVAVR